MAQQPQVQYVNDNILLGTEAPKFGWIRKIPKVPLPPIRMAHFKRLYINPQGMISITVALCVLAMLIFGTLQMRETKAEYEQLNTYLSDLKRENFYLSHTYHTSYDLEEIHAKALKIGMIEGEESNRFTVFINLPKAEKETTRWDDFIWLLSGLLSEPRRN